MGDHKFMRLPLLFLPPLLLSACLLGDRRGPRPPRGPAWIPAGAFVRAKGTGFVAAGKPFRFVGANIEGVHGPERRARHLEVLQALANDGMTVARQWALGEGGPDDPEYAKRYQLFRVGPEGFVEETYQALDQVLASARGLGIRVILTLSNHWKDYGGIHAYLRWAGLSGEGFAWEAFYFDERVRGYYRAGLLKLLERRNTVTGVRYVDDPTIFSWELMNESVVLTAAGAAARRRWIVEMARFIKARDRNHMVSAGLLGYAMRSERDEWIRVQQLPEIDYCDSHLYPQDEGSVTSLARLADLIDDRAQLSRFVIKKPLVLGEFGFRTDEGPLWLGEPRAAWFGRFVERALRDGAAGVLVWIYQPHFGQPRNYGIYTDHADTLDVRRALSHFALQAKGARGKVSPFSENPRLRADQGSALLYEAQVRLGGPEAPHDGWRSRGGEQVLLIPPEDFAEARFERAGSWKGGAIVHAYGANVGRFTYRFTAPLGPPPRALSVLARLSSEWPGAAAPPDGGSPVLVLLDGREVARLQAIPDDGQGQIEQATITDPRILGTLAPGPHTLTFEVPDGPASHGLCIYGDPTGSPPLSPARFQPIRLRWLPGPLPQ